jgi:parvulin-like peptidyl-prolyl cis-trans isomerase-like protein
MSATTTSPELATAARPHRRPSLPGWLGEPLLHFVVLGAVLFGVDHVLATRAGDPNTIVIDAAVDREAQMVFYGGRQRWPTPKELEALRQVWLDNEVLYREGLALQVDKGDPGIRDRVIFKALSVIEAGLTLPPIDDEGLRAYFESHRDKYDEPARYDFEEAALAAEPSEATVRGFVDELNTGTPGDVDAGLRVFTGRPHQNLLDSYGAEFTQEIAAATPGEWRAMRTREGWRAMRLNGITPAKPAVFESFRGVVLADWTDETAAEHRTAGVRALARKYTVVVETPAADVPPPSTQGLHEPQ